jgi:hypothetical protein
VLLYALFFIMCFWRLGRWWHLLLLSVASIALARFFKFSLLEASVCFFIGGLTYHIFLHLWKGGLSAPLLLVLVFLTASLWIFIPYNYSYRILDKGFLLMPGHESLVIGHTNIGRDVLDRVTEYSYDIVLFPLTILTLAACEAFRGTLGKRFAFLGNISYSIYLWHFPLQLAVVIGLLAASIPLGVLYSPWVLLGFFSFLIPLAGCSYYYFERPVQELLRKRLL